ncbi:diacylglycerol kinase [Aerococcus agrisoli]|uniref:Diacylglycerol kinase n=1 Tax=Aerococcus agrisoli TaxID=2487350 RepID=A0A3N4HAE0_9LACT|nr:diacylglycerol kinase family protein [Aerococcus agrisoli]RPA62424.1 diacylglycerol kinase [Aerococcus agrisoli]
MSNRGYLFIFNQAAGKRKKNDISQMIIKEAEHNGIHKENLFLVYSTSIQSSQFLIERFADRYTDGVVIACGGDGTVLSIGNLVMNTSLIFAILPLGTGNDLYSGLYGKRTIPDQLRHIFAGATAATDAIFIPEIDQYVLNIASVGLDASVVEAANSFKDKVKLFQKYAYMVSIPNALKGGTAFHIDIKAKFGQEVLMVEPSPYILAAICNGTMYGGGFKVNPNGEIDDGILELVYADHLPTRKILPLIMKFFSGNHENVDAIHHLSCDWVHYASKDGSDMVVNCDGEIYHLPAFTAQVKKHAYRRIV